MAILGRGQPFKPKLGRFIGGATIAASGTAAGLGDASGIGASTNAQAASSAGTGSASGVATATAAGVVTSAGTGAAVGVGTSSAAAVATAAGVGDAAGVGSSTSSAVGTAAGTGDATGAGASTNSAAASAAGVGAAAGVGTEVVAGAGTAAGTSTASAEGLNVLAGTGTATGAGTATGVGFSKGPGRVSQFVEEYANGQGATTRVTSHAVEFADGQGANARVTAHALEVANGQPARVRVTSFVIEVAYRTTSISPVTPPFPGWSTCPPTDPAVTPGQGDGGFGSYGWPPASPDPVSAIFEASPDHDEEIDGVALVDGYQGRYSTEGSDDLVIDYGKPTPDADGFITITLPHLTVGATFTLSIDTTGPGGTEGGPASDAFVEVS